MALAALQPVRSATALHVVVPSAPTDLLSFGRPFHPIKAAAAFQRLRSLVIIGHDQVPLVVTLEHRVGWVVGSIDDLSVEVSFGLAFSRT